MNKILLLLVLVYCSARSQRLSHVRVVNHTDYILRVVQETVNEVEHREWCNLKLPDIVVPVNETVIDRHYNGTVTYTNGFVVSIQQIDVQQSTVQQVWNWNNTEKEGTVSLEGTLRMTNLALGYDVLVEMVDGHHRYTAVYKHPLISFAFSIIYSIHEQNIDEVTVVGTVPRTSTVFPDISPKDRTSDVLTVLFDPQHTAPGIMAWGPDVFQPITTEVVARVDFPRICYDCPP